METDPVLVQPAHSFKTGGGWLIWQKAHCLQQSSKQHVGKRTFVRSAGPYFRLTSIKSSVLPSTCPKVIIKESDSPQPFTEHLGSEVTGPQWHSLQGGVSPSAYWNLEGRRAGLGAARTKRDFLGHFLGLMTAMYLLQMPSFLFSFVEIESNPKSFIASKMENISQCPVSKLSIKEK